METLSIELQNLHDRIDAQAVRLKALEDLGRNNTGTEDIPEHYVPIGGKIGQTSPEKFLFDDVPDTHSPLE